MLVLQNYAWVKDPFKVQDRQIDFKITECEKLTDRVSNCLLQLTFKKQLLVKFCYSIKEECPPLIEKT